MCDLEIETEPEVVAAINALLPEEYFAIADASIELADLQITNIETRILAIRARQLSGEIRDRTTEVDLSGFSIRLFGESIPSIVPHTAVKHLFAQGGSSGGSGFISPWGFFANGNLVVGRSDTTVNEAGRDFDTRGLTTGADYIVNDLSLIHI